MLLVSKISRRLKEIVNVIKTFPENLQTSLVPSEERKSNLRILLECLYLCARWGPMGYVFHFSLKMDRKGVKLRDHVTEGEFVRLREFVNFNYPSPKLAYPGITKDKILSKKLLAALGASVPVQYCSVTLENGDLYCRDEEGRPVNLEQLRNKPLCYKPVEAECGDGVMMFCILDNGQAQLNGENCSLQSLKDNMVSQIKAWGRGMIEDRIVQHPDLANLYSKSVNSLRIITVLDETDKNGVRLLGAFLRVGAAGNNVDNYAVGGLIINVKPDGKLEKYGYIRPEYGNAETMVHPDTGITLENFSVPFFEEAISLCIKIHRQLPGIYSIGWDVAITAEGPLIVEINDNWELEPIEHCTGQGLRREYEETFVATARKLGKR